MKHRFLHSQAGVTLIETMVALALFVLVATLAVSSITMFNGFTVRTEIDKLHATCMYLQRLAYTTGQSYTISFDQEHNNYTFEGATQQLPSQVVFGYLPKVKGPPASPKKEISSAVTFGQKSIVFHPDGIIQPGTLYLVDKGRHHMYALTCAVAQFSYLRRYCYTGAWELL
jgi:prepilin-type N-terminal cleavage/methylation domain-containing protein